MTRELTLFLSLHVYLLLIAAVMFYGILLNLLAKRGTTKKALIWKSLVGLVTVVASFVTAKVFLDGYFIGKLGFVTDSSVTSLVPTLVYAREIMLPVLAVASFILTILFWTKGAVVNEYYKLKMTLIILASLSFIFASALTFLGILVP